jgi:hypothetical protein
MDELEAGVEFAVAVVSSSSAFLQPGAVISCRHGMPILPYLHEPRPVPTSPTKKFVFIYYVQAVLVAGLSRSLLKFVWQASPVD